jgi:hypothetical protein
MKTDDTLVVPETITAPWLKRFFKNHLGIPVFVENARSSGWVGIRIRCDQPRPGESIHAPIRYSHTFPAEFGRRCMGIVYEKSEALSKQYWGGNISSHMIAMHGQELRRLLQGLIDSPITERVQHTH